MSGPLLTIAVCDDEPAARAYLTALVRKWADAASVAIRVTAYDSAESFLFAYEVDNTADILLLDIQMKVMDGVALARRLRAAGNAAQIVFITGVPDFIAEGYDVSALHYLLKPVKEDKLYEVLDRARANASKRGKSLLLTAGGETRRVPLTEIRYIEAQGHYVAIRTAACEHRFKANLSDIEKQLDECFFRCQRSFIVNLTCVRTITRTVVVLDDGTEVPLSRSLYDAAHRAMINAF